MWLAWVDGGATTTYTDSGLTTGQEYRYAVGASRGTGTESVWSGQVTATAAATDSTAPTVTSATVDGATLAITFNETLAAAASLANSAFAVEKTPAGGSEETVTLGGSPSISGATVTLTLAAAVAHDDTGVQVSYTKPAAGSNNKLKDAADNEVASFTDRAVTNNSADSTAPTVTSATVDGATLAITFNETLAAAASLANSAFAVEKTPAGGSEETVTLGGSPSISGATVTLADRPRRWPTDGGHRGAGQLHQAGGGQQQQAQGCGGQRGGEFHRPGGDQQQRAPRRRRVDGERHDRHVRQPGDGGRRPRGGRLQRVPL